jgi:MFS family permease
MVDGRGHILRRAHAARTMQRSIPTHASIPHGSMKLVLAAISLALFMDSLVYGMIAPVVPYYADVIGASDLEIGIIFSAYPIVQLLTLMPVGALSDRYGRRPFIILGLIILIVSTIAFAISDNVPQLILTRGIQGLAASCTITAGLALVSEGVPSDRRGGTLAVATASQGAGIMAGPLFGGSLVDVGGYPFPFLVAAALTLIILTLTATALRGPRPKHLERDRCARTGHGEVLRDKTVLAIVLIVVIWGVGFGIIEPAYPLYLSEDFSATASMIGVFFTAMSIPSVLSQPFFGRLSDKIGRKRIVITASLLFSMLFSLMAMVDSFSLLLAVSALLGMSSGMLWAPSLPLMIESMTRRLGKGSAGIANGLYNSAWALGLAGGPLIFGLLVEPIGLEPISLVYSTIAAAIAVASIWLITECRG